ncbi:hypothetical protein GA0070616_1305 [Micromonospora nigra]|uniref:Uncharacterized protein n=1 Tax=Micromonospora nigra TaxID=145857 RepID=A0A1C6RK60_9ACTN|nr:hypothetical protein [Micromonospora nigra]SCL17564.1 hypothetical protein GA0070616_1305 [Micromonospora nigra]
MTYDLSPTPAIYESQSSHDSQSSNGNGVRNQAQQVGSEAAKAGGAVAETAREQGREVGHEAARQARDLYGEARTQLSGQAGEQQRRAAGGLRSLADEMRSMADNGGQGGPVSEIARQAADRVHGAAGWLEQREPGDLLTEVRDYARRNPGTFLIGAAVLGVVAGRLTRNLASTGDGGPGQTNDGYDPDRTAVIPTPASRAVPDAVPPGGYLDPQPGSYADPQTGYADPQPDAYTDPTRGGYAEPTGTGQPLPPPSQTDPLPGVPASGTNRP